MTNKEIIRQVNEGFARGDSDLILSHVADDVSWEIMGISTHHGREEFAREIKNENFEGIPQITITGEIEEGDRVAVEGMVETNLRGGAPFSLYFHNFYRLVDGKIKEMRSYLVERKR
ncbi:MAG: nuclear transport factor 2 family protein [Pyrinomonadaceae bacterium]